MDRVERWLGKNGESSDKIYDLWQQKHKLRHGAFVLALAMYVMIFMVFFDYLFVKNPLPFIYARIATVALLFPSFLLTLALPKSSLTPRVSYFLKSCLLLAGPIFFHLQYFYFVFIHQHEKVSVYFTGLLLIIFYGSFVLHRFAKEQLIFNMTGIIGTLPFVFLYREKADLAYIVIVSHLVSVFVFTYFRKDFINNLQSIYNLLQTMVPKQVAEILAISNKTTDTTDHFRPQNRFTVCLCADWRNFQRLASVRSSDEVSLMLEKFYDNVVITLDRLVPSNNYYFNWTADELFIIFFDDKDAKDRVLRDALVFAEALVTEVYDKSRQEVGIDIEFDVGMASGIGLLGLQGPRHMKKTTITGAVAGRAKRFQTEAKRLRIQHFPTGKPILVVDDMIYQFQKGSPISNLLPFLSTTAQTKDIKDLVCYFSSGQKKAAVPMLKPDSREGGVRSLQKAPKRRKNSA